MNVVVNLNSGRMDGYTATRIPQHNSNPNSMHTLSRTVPNLQKIEWGGWGDPENRKICVKRQMVRFMEGGNLPTL